MSDDIGIDRIRHSYNVLPPAPDGSRGPFLGDWRPAGVKKDDTVTIRRKVERALANLEETALALREKMFVACSNLPDLEPEFDAFDRAFSRLVDARKPPTLEERAVEVCRKMLRREHAEDSINTRWLTEAIYKEVAAIVKEANRADK